MQYLLMKVESMKQSEEPESIRVEMEESERVENNLLQETEVPEVENKSGQGTEALEIENRPSSEQGERKMGRENECGSASADTFKCGAHSTRRGCLQPSNRAVPG